MSRQQGKTSAGIEVRETINQGFVHAELASATDSKAKAVYQAAEINPSLLERHANMAVDNYMAAISCYLRAIPGVQDTRSSRLLREEVDKLLKRLERMRALLLEAERLKTLNGGRPVRLTDNEREKFENEQVQNFEDELEADVLTSNAFDAAQNHDIWVPEYDVGTEIDVYDPLNKIWNPATITAHENSSRTYNVRYDESRNNEEERNVDAPRIRLREPSDLLLNSLDQESMSEKRYEVVSELIESERTYVKKLHDLKQHYIDTFKKPAHWGGQRESGDTLFTRKTMSDDETRKVFANIEEIIQMNSKFLSELEERFVNYTDDQGFADIFIKYSPYFKAYTPYIIGYEEGAKLLKSMRQERMGIRSAEAAAAAHGIDPLPTLIALPRDRLYVYTKLLKDLEDRTPRNHSSKKNVETALKFFKTVERQVWEEKNRDLLRKQVQRLEKLFKPSISLMTPQRVFYHEGDIKILEDRKPKLRHVWLFNDLIVYGRPSWINNGFYRHKGSITISEYGNAPEFGPCAIFVSNEQGHRLQIIASNEKEKNFWKNQLSRCPKARLCSIDKEEQDQMRELQNQMNNSLVLETPYKPPPPPREPEKPGEPELPKGWVELVDDSTNKLYYYNEIEGVTQWEKPTY